MRSWSRNSTEGAEMPEEQGEPPPPVEEGSADAGEVSAESDPSAEVAETSADERMIALSLRGADGESAPDQGRDDPSPEVADEPAPDTPVEKGD